METTFRNHNLPDYDWRGYNDLRRAIQSQKEFLVLRLVNNGVELNTHCPELLSRTPLHWAVLSRSFKIVEILLHGGAKTGVKDWNWDTPLTLAAKIGDIDLMGLLLSQDVQNHKNKERFSHLHAACIINSVGTVEKLLSKDHLRNINEAVSSDSMLWPGYTALHFAVHYGSTETVKCLLKAGADMMAEDFRKLTPLHLAFLQQHEETIDLILSAHKNEFKNPVSPQGLSHFHIACTRNDASVIQHFLKLKVDVNRSISSAQDTPWRNFTPLHFAIYYGCLETMNCLLKAGAELGGHVFSSLLNQAFIEQNYDVYNLLCSDKAASMHKEDEEFEIISDLHRACIKNDREEIDLLWNAEASSSLNINAPVAMGLTALHLAVKYDSMEAVKYLLDHGADIMVQDSKGDTPVHVAFKCGFVEVYELLFGHETSQIKNLINDQRLSIFHILCTTDRAEAIENLLQTGVSINAQVGSESLCWAEFTALHFACLFRRTKVIKLLLAYNANILITNGLSQNPLDLIMKDLHSFRFNKMNEALPYLSTIMLYDENRSLHIQGISLLHMLSVNHTIDLGAVHQYLLDHKDEINSFTNIPESQSYNKCTPLHFAVQFQNLPCAKLLLENGADPFLVNSEGKTPLEYMLSYGYLLFSSVSALAESCFSAVIHRLKPSHFHIACALELTNTVKSVLNKVPEGITKLRLLNCPDDNGSTPLHSLSKDTFDVDLRLEITRLLLENGADANIYDYELKTPLHEASCSDDIEDFQMLIEHGGDVNAQNIYGETPLHSLLSDRIASDATLTAVLLDAGTDINLLDRRGQTCLMILKKDLGFVNGQEDDENYYDGFYDCIITFLKHVKKLQMVGFFISDLNVQAYSESVDLLGNDRFEEAPFISECKRELDMMQAVHLDRYTTMRDLLLKSANEMVFHWNNVNLQSIVDSNDFSEKYSIYGSLIKLQLKRGRTRRPLLNESEKSLTHLIGKQLPRSCLESMLQYLSNKDLEHIIISVKNRIE